MAYGASSGTPFSSINTLMSSPAYWGAQGLSGGIGGFMDAQGYNNLSNMIGQGLGGATNYFNQGMGYLQPWQTAGARALPQFQASNMRFADPTAYYNHVFNNYQETPYAQFQQGQMQQAENNSAAAGGTLGSPAEQKQMADYTQGLVSKDQNQYFGNIMGINDMYMGNLSKLMGQGLQAGGMMDQNRMGLGDMYNRDYSDMGLAQLMAQRSEGSGIGSLLGGATDMLTLGGLL